MHLGELFDRFSTKVPKADCVRWAFKRIGGMLTGTPLCCMRCSDQLGWANRGQRPSYQNRPWGAHWSQIRVHGESSSSFSSRRYLLSYQFLHISCILRSALRPDLSQLGPRRLMNTSSDAANSSRKIADAIPGKRDTTLTCISIFVLMIVSRLFSSWLLALYLAFSSGHSAPIMALVV